MTKTTSPGSRVVFVLIDTLRADHVGWYARRYVGTPTLDRLASQGVVFSNAISQAPATRGSVSSIFTGLYPSQHGLLDRVRNARKGTASVAGLGEGVPTLAGLLAASGYVTAAFVGGNANLKPVFGLTRGFLHVEFLDTTDGSVLVERFERFIEASPPERTFCYLHFMDVHNPLPDRMIPSRLDDGLDLGLVEESMGQLAAYYADAVRLVDGHVARVVKALEAAGMLDDTLLIVTADHGEEHMEHGAMLAHGRSLYRELVHIPLIMKLPGGEYAGSVVGRPVQMINLMPTVLEVAGCPQPDLAGRSLLPAIEGRDTDRPLAFSELLRRDHYCQSATSSTHQLIVKYLLKEPAVASPADLQPGVTVNCKGQLIQGGEFLPTKLWLTPKSQARVRGTVDAIGPRPGSLTVLGVSFDSDGTTAWVGLDGEAIDPSEIKVGDWVGAALVLTPDGGYRATTVHRRKAGGKSHIVGPIEHVRHSADGLCLITALGTEIVVGPNVTLEARYADPRSDHSKFDALARVLDADHLGRQVELYDLTTDPTQTRNIVNERPDIAQELEAHLATWTEELITHTPATTTNTTIDVDPETLEQLKKMGYVD